MNKLTSILILSFLTLSSNLFSVEKELNHKNTVEQKHQAKLSKMDLAKIGAASLGFICSSIGCGLSSYVAWDCFKTGSGGNYDFSGVIGLPLTCAACTSGALSGIFGLYLYNKIAALKSKKQK